MVVVGDEQWQVNDIYLAWRLKFSALPDPFASQQGRHVF